MASNLSAIVEFCANLATKAVSIEGDGRVLSMAQEQPIQSLIINNQPEQLQQLLFQ